MVKLLYFLLYRVETQFNQEHLFLLVNEFLDVLGSHLLLTREGDTAFSDMHGGADVAALLTIEVVDIIFQKGGRDISILDSTEGHTGGRGLFVPNFEVFGTFLSLLPFLFLSLSSDEDLFVVKFSEW